MRNAAKIAPDLRMAILNMRRGMLGLEAQYKGLLWQIEAMTAKMKINLYTKNKQMEARLRRWADLIDQRTQEAEVIRKTMLSCYGQFVALWTKYCNGDEKEAVALARFLISEEKPEIIIADMGITIADFKKYINDWRTICFQSFDPAYDPKILLNARMYAGKTKREKSWKEYMNSKNKVESGESATNPVDT